MPDWVYRTVAQRALFCLPDKLGRHLALGTIGLLGKTRGGRAVIEFMGHMAPDPALRTTVAGIEFSSPIGIGWRVDPEQRATSGLSCFGVGCIEVQRGPVRNVRRANGHSLRDEPVVGGVNTSRNCGMQVPLLERGVDPSGRETLRFPNGIAIPVAAWDATPAGVPQATDGILLQAGTARDAYLWTVPAETLPTLYAHIRAWRERLPADAPLVVSGGLGTPGDVVAALEAGANLVLVDAALVYRGPGFIKRCNTAAALKRSRPLASARIPLFRRAWFWAAALGAMMATGGVLTLTLALTRVLLPYDEHYLGLDAVALQRNSPRLFAFMAHDRATLAGTMLGLGWLYFALAWFGMRRGRHGVRSAVIASACAGFVSFFAFFGFGYFDTLHAFVAAVLLQVTIQIMVGEDHAEVSPDPDEIDEEDAAWRTAQWGQLLWVIHSVGLLLAGLTILGIGMTSVFVREDLDFLCLTAEQAHDLGRRLTGVVAHDRATLGGMLLASGVAMLLPVLWCFQRRAAWLWQSLLGLGVLAYAAAIGIHVHVGYSDWRHMVPALAGLALWLGGLLLSRRYLLPRARA